MLSRTVSPEVPPCARVSEATVSFWLGTLRLFRRTSLAPFQGPRTAIRPTDVCHHSLILTCTRALGFRSAGRDFHRGAIGGGTFHDAFPRFGGGVRMREEYWSFVARIRSFASDIPSPLGSPLLPSQVRLRGKSFLHPRI